MDNIADEWVSAELALFPYALYSEFECSLLSFQNLQTRTLELFDSVLIMPILAHRIYLKCLILEY